MTRDQISDIAFTPAVKAQQEQRGSREAYARMESRGGWSDRITPELTEFIGARDSFYFGTASAEGQPYIQHRGGPRGFLKVLDAERLAFADYAGNSQYISIGNLTENDKVVIFLMDYPHRKRIKIWGTASYVEDDLELLDRVRDPEYDARPERAIVVTVKAWDLNCPQHITPRYTIDEVKSAAER